MVNRRLGILFLVAVLLSFLTGYFAKEIMPAFFSGEPSESFDFVTDFLEDNYYYELDENAIDQAYIDSLYRIVESYGNQNNDPYTRLFAFPQIDDVRFDEFYIGMGIEIQIEEDQIRITAVNKDSDAFGKLMPNDLIIGVVIEDQEIMFDALESDENMILYLSVKDEVQKTLIIQTPDLDVFHETIFVKTISTPSIESKALGEEDIAYIKINQFHAFMHETLSPGTSFLFKQALNILESEMLLDNPESKTLIIDLRDNPGGALTALHNAFSSDVHIPGIIQELLPRSLEKPIFSMIPRNTELARDFNNTRLEKKP
ncbi:MAG: S41 family peptidase, partial [Acholeplasmataceae bacterium]|nr:S41 family peptidase [Acholeplasmataceae bacterium]